MPLMRTMSMDHRWQDLASFLSLPDGSNLSSHHGHSHSHSHHPLSHSLSSHSHHFVHPYPHSHTPHAPIHNPHSYGVHSAAAAAAAVGHHYGGLSSASAPVAAYSAADSGRSVLLQNATIGPTLTELGANGSYPSPSIGEDRCFPWIPLVRFDKLHER